MPSPVGRPADTVRPEVSECSRMPASRRPAASATSPCAPSWAMVTTVRAGRHRAGDPTTTAAATSAPTRTAVGTWFLLLAAPKAVLELLRARRRRAAPDSDVDQLARLTRVPAVLWVGVFLLVDVGALLLGGWWLLG